MNESELLNGSDTVFTLPIHKRFRLLVGLVWEHIIYYGAHCVCMLETNLFDLIIVLEL